MSRFFGSRRHGPPDAPEQEELLGLESLFAEEASRFELLDLRLYTAAREHLEAFEREAPGFGPGAVAYTWLSSQTLSRFARKYVYKGFAHLLGHPEGAGWEDLPTNDELDRYIWALYRAWIDRHGEATTVE